MENTKESKTLVIDFDGTCLTNENYPSIGKDIGAVPVLKAIIKSGHKLILWTRRDGFALDNAVKWFKDNDIELSAINPKQKGSPKIDYDIYIDDKAINAPLKKPSTGKPYINWVLVKVYLQRDGIL